MLIYHPMLDPYHCSLRTLSLLSDGGLEQIEWDRLRLLDLLIVFPHTLKKMRVPVDFLAWRVVLQAVPEPYETLPNLTRVFYQVAEIQAAAMGLLVASGLIQKDSMEEGTIRVARPRDEQRLALASAMQKLHYRSERWYSFVLECLISYPLNGSGGLKERTGLMEHRHDTA